VNPEQVASRRLILLRHAKSQWPDGMLDKDRPLAERGIADATAAGPILAEIADPDVVLCSPAVRTRQTWRLVSQALTDPPESRFEPTIYGASAAELVEVIRSVPSEAGTVLVIGHEPTMSSTADLLAAPGSHPDDLARLRDKYPTSGMAVFSVPASWADLGPKSAVLERFLTPKG
jgi:phosphohistidine phosphatase